MVEAIDKLNQTAKVEYLHVGRDFIKATNYVGVLKFGNINIQVLPKIDNQIDVSRVDFQNELSTAARYLMLMLSYSFKLKIQTNEVTQLSRSENNWFEILTRIFSKHLNKLIRSGLYHEYVNVDDRTSVIKGKWKLTEQLIKIPHIRHEFLVTYDDFSIDNQINQILKLASSIMILHSNDKKNKKMLAEIITWYSDVSDISSIGLDLQL